MPDHHPDEPFYRRAVSELQEVEETINLATNRKYFGRFPKRRARRSGLSGYYQKAFDRVWLGLTFKLITYDIPSPSHSPHPLVSH
ncbi:hypothetical protein TNCV_1579881 [Trichonephila clavipes]|nr:hypothetical protein TNCV_1579881 [Trichonephila clavipes]